MTNPVQCVSKHTAQQEEMRTKLMLPASDCLQLSIVTASVLAILKESEIVHALPPVFCFVFFPVETQSQQSKRWTCQIKHFDKKNRDNFNIIFQGLSWCFYSGPHGFSITTNSSIWWRKPRRVRQWYLTWVWKGPTVIQTPVFFFNPALIAAKCAISDRMRVFVLCSLPTGTKWHFVT